MTDATLLFAEEWNRELAEASAKTDVPREEWRSGGRATKQYPDKENHTWWFDNGPAMVQRYIDWRNSTPNLEIAEFDEEPAIELDIRCTFGRTPVRAIIDRVFVNTETGELIVVDLKSGANMPTDQGLQLGFYASALEVKFGTRPSWAAFWDARKGGLHEPVNVSRFTPELLGQMLGEFDKARRQGLFIPHLNRMCGTCSVKDHCLAYGGAHASTSDPLYQIVRNASE